MNNKWLLWMVTISVFLAAGCGGGSSDSSPPPVQPTPTPTPVPQADTVSLAENGLFLHGDLTAEVGESVGFAITTDDQLEVSRVQWTQVSGPQSTVLAGHTQAIGFDANVAGDYQFSVQTELSSGATRQLNFVLSVTEGLPVQANVRLDHSATERGRVSLRVDTDPSKTVDAIQWQQTSGPSVQSVSFGADDRTEESEQVRPNSLFFAAPSVTRDSVVEYQAQVRYSDGTEAQDTVLVLIDNININPDGYFTGSDLFVSSHMLPYRENSPFASALRNCVYNNQVDSSCSFNELPLIGMQTSTPSIEDILNRTLVSHPWMGERFEEYLRESQAGADMLNLLRGTTAVVISYDIRPSFYWVTSGAIYLDANNFWRTPQERDTLNTAPDFRNDFGNALNVGIFWRYVNNETSYLSQAFPRAAERGSKPFSGLEASLTWLMYHELGHANDFFPPRAWNSISRLTSPLQYFRDNEPDSTQMTGLYPLTSPELDALADVSFGGATATETQKSFTPLDVESFYSPDIAPAYYAYFTTREDYATLFERFMMLYRLGISADTGIIATTNNPNTEVTWGVRTRINDPALRNRLRYAVERIYPELDFDQIQPTLPETIVFPANENWFDLLTFGMPNEAVLNSQDEGRVKALQKQEERFIGFEGLPHLHLHHTDHDPSTLPHK